MYREALTFNRVPVLAVYEGRREDAAAKGCILFFHGLGASKDVQLGDLESLAERGFLAVGVDNVGHGARRYPDFDTRFSPQNSGREKAFLEAVQGTAREVPSLVDALTEVGLIHEARVGILGISMGGFITYAAIILEPRLKAAVTLVASPKWADDLSESPHNHLEGFGHIRLLSQTAGRDAQVPNQGSRAFHKQLRQTYSDYDERFAYAEYPESDHFLETDWSRCWARTLEWFETQLAASDYPSR